MPEPSSDSGSSQITREWTDGDLLLRERDEKEAWVKGCPVWLDDWQ